MGLTIVKGINVEVESAPTPHIEKLFNARTAEQYSNTRVNKIFTLLIEAVKR